MALLNILEFPDPRLRTKATPVTEVDGEITQLIDDMFETMYDAPGIGLAATQINVHKRVVVIDLSEDKNEPMVLINPEYDILDDEREESQEGCLSVPEYYETVERANHILLRALDRNGEPYELEATGLLAVCIQHEIDHLEGKLFVDYLSTLKRNRIRSKLEKKHRREAHA
ncbi:peptide deformylase [Motiliproteus sp. MSK22-1]|uniref:peptide deformylase n=1 Tax=Motiliproteus sp. MSK22-1 TaxID=1897630 RepID=UPI00097723E5|nr:peptide deformylase [Motiliproteus sp. MSK22-1]OMH39464.1 peptide deformylase [Motiliproteus sp. MSK22-1]